MNSEEFISALRVSVRDASISDAIKVIGDPPGRKISPEAKQLSEWYKSLGSQERDFVARIITDAVDRAIFGFLCVLDGVRAIEGARDKGRLVLFYDRESRVLLNNPDDEYLHDIYNSG